jgi:hypothetical protein
VLDESFDWRGDERGAVVATLAWSAGRLLPWAAPRGRSALCARIADALRADFTVYPWDRSAAEPR